jgi:HD-GYP domain-containing protein (c-di-GMP phosphodiesterase class II)
MTVSQLNGPEELFNARDEIAATLYANIAPEERTLIVRLLARSFADEYAGAIMENRPPAVVAWAEEMCAKPGRAKAVEHVFAAAASLPKYLRERGLPDRYLAPLPVLGDAAHAVAAGERGNGHFGHLNEIDAEIAGLLASASVEDAAHARNVSAWSARLARRMALTEGQITFVTRAAQLHEAGESAATGALLGAFAPVIRSHGSVLEGQTSDAARIIAVACAFCAAIEGRGGDAPQSPEAALDAVLAGCGENYDVVVVAALHELVIRQ